MILRKQSSKYWSCVKRGVYTGKAPLILCLLFEYSFEEINKKTWKIVFEQVQGSEVISQEIVLLCCVFCSCTCTYPPFIRLDVEKSFSQVACFCCDLCCVCCWLCATRLVREKGRGRRRETEGKRIQENLCYNLSHFFLFPCHTPSKPPHHSLSSLSLWPSCFHQPDALFW